VLGSVSSLRFLQRSVVILFFEFCGGDGCIKSVDWLTDSVVVGITTDRTGMRSEGLPWVGFGCCCLVPSPCVCGGYGSANTGFILLLVLCSVVLAFFFPFF
jgi:hypothetical protein